MKSFSYTDKKYTSVFIELFTCSSINYIEALKNINILDIWFCYLYSSDRHNEMKNK